MVKSIYNKNLKYLKNPFFLSDKANPKQEGRPNKVRDGTLS